MTQAPEAQTETLTLSDIAAEIGFELTQEEQTPQEPTADPADSTAETDPSQEKPEETEDSPDSTDSSDESETESEEKPEDEGGWVNGGFMVVRPEMLKSVTSANQSLEADILPKLAKQGLVACFKHYGFWQPVDTIRDLEKLNLYANTAEGDWISS